MPTDPCRLVQQVKEFGGSTPDEPAGVAETAQDQGARPV
jgi:hypothetical protein